MDETLEECNLCEKQQLSGLLWAPNLPCMCWWGVQFENNEAHGACRGIVCWSVHRNTHTHRRTRARTRIRTHNTQLHRQRVMAFT